MNRKRLKEKEEEGKGEKKGTTDLCKLRKIDFSENDQWNGRTSPQIEKNKTQRERRDGDYQNDVDDAPDDEAV